MTAATDPAHTTALAPAALRAWRVLFAEVARVEGNGRVVPCRRMPAPFTSDDCAERAEAAESCEWCPVVVLCASYAEHAGEAAHVWGGHDRTAASASCRASR